MCIVVSDEVLRVVKERFLEVGRRYGMPLPKVSEWFGVARL